MAALREFQPSEPLSGPIAVTLDIYWPWRKGDSAKVRAGGKIPCLVKPDCDNLAKTIIDVMVLLNFFARDQYVYFLRVTKWFSDSPGMTFIISEG